ncbi:hypothetical protein HMPREF0202_01837 [Cetobacterium somerae ATCC BAA-474]|uniref:Pili assembly chaperone N-terminal domain-containing protein n=1 Tax=Cetobacterium somerae ATCC BAA-474 TaxID=1319815 RepID=U7V997_9FUSO|nr:hypothetical protein [Cetobacterium somerae]ERT68267.1 hypothetical protein HMPREF0202_01837 [Cetobacterium somerae ATCC BAA-474]
MKLKTATIILFFFMANFLFSLQIGPPMYEQRIDGNGGYREFTIKNSGDETLRYKLTILPTLENHKDMSKWTEVSPKILTIKPGKSGKIKIYSNAPKGAEEGEYGFILSVKMIGLPRLPEETHLIESSAKINFDVHLELFGYVGNLEPKVKLTNLKTRKKDNQIIISGKLENLTLKRGVYCGIDIIGKNGTIYNSDLRVPVNSEKEFNIELDKNIKQSEITGIRIRDLENYKEILKQKI